MVQDVPRVWTAPTTTPADRERMLRCLIRDVSLDSFTQSGQTRILISWQTDTVTTITVHRPTPGDAHRLPAATVELIRTQAQQHPDDRIAEILNQQGLKTQQGWDWSYRRVMETRRRHHLPTACPIVPRNDQPRSDGLLSCEAASQQFHSSANTILLRAQKGILYNEHKPGVNPVWVRITPEDVMRLNQSSPPPESVPVRQVRRELHLSQAQFWELVRLRRYTVYRVREGKHWEFWVHLC